MSYSLPSFNSRKPCSMVLSSIEEIQRRREPESDFETRIYLYENALRTEFSRVTAEIDPNNAEKLCDLKTFKAELSENGLLTITADGMTAGAYCDGGGAA